MCIGWKFTSRVYNNNIVVIVNLFPNLIERYTVNVVMKRVENKV